MLDMDTGVARWGTLRERASRAEIDRAVADGDIIKLRRDWYATPTAHPDVVRAVMAGGVLSCASALALHGVWVPPMDKLHIRGNDATARLHPDWCRQRGRQPAERAAVDDLETSLRHAAKCLPEEDFIVICDSLLNRGLVAPSTLEYWFGSGPRTVTERLQRCDGRAESGTETMARLRFQSRNLRVRTQVRIPEVGRVDMVIGESLIVEVDGYAYHADPETFENDRLRDLHAKALGYNVIRLTFKQVVYQWNVVEPLILEIVRRREHLKPLPALARTATTF